ncbi:homoserine dehydrogenase [Gloeobacter kilaueensis]|uniref:Homoserine dehydrogenase n=1 Tax=Gloeobacter kilaueensis (strain ATCC BAA-2537 / CCAP 1431/1 / ULC 316 / JS1) TaxID=1183438 RepID=U5QN80_GLOK1|nr:homoserine dehydrogenase [Gloeobacter kilaueensis]AGY59064.1 homoserine dehydrogenase [Gloeobacter kilaueensis JS1]
MAGTLRLALIGLGTVGSSVLAILNDVAGLDLRLGAVQVVAAAVRDLTKARNGPLPPLYEDALALACRPDIDVVVEVMGGVELPYQLLKAALKAGKHVITANKALLARHGEELFALARTQNRQLRYEAAVGGGIPLLQPIEQCLGANHIQAVTAIINGTTNYILTQMATRQIAYEEALAEAQSLGYAEADPRADVEGNDAQEKLTLLAALAFRTPLPDLAAVYREGITAVALPDVMNAQQLGFAIKLLAIATRTADGRLDLRVHPTLVPLDHPLSRVDGAYNAVLIQAEPVGSIMFYGPGAGGGPTASAVVSDIINILADAPTGAIPPASEAAPLHYLPITAVQTRFYIRLRALDQPGVIGHIGQIFGQHAVSLASIVQKNPRGAAAELVIITHDVPEARLRAALAELRASAVVQEFCTAIRVLPEGKR